MDDSIESQMRDQPRRSSTQLDFLEVDRESALRGWALFFRARGRYRLGNAPAVSPGNFYSDNAAKKRWVLKADNLKTPAGIDAVLVTVEPPGGGSHPSGKPCSSPICESRPINPDPKLTVDLTEHSANLIGSDHTSRSE
jgi:hypothetical protein